MGQMLGFLAILALLLKGILSEVIGFSPSAEVPTGAFTLVVFEAFKPTSRLLSARILLPESSRGASYPIPVFAFLNVNELSMKRMAFGDKEEPEPWFNY